MKSASSSWKNATANYLTGLSNIRGVKGWTNNELERVLELTANTLISAAGLREYFPISTYKFTTVLSSIGRADEFTNKAVRVCPCEKMLYYGATENTTWCSECGRDRADSATFYCHSVRERYETWYREPRIQSLLTNWIHSADPAARDNDTIKDFYDGELFKEELWPLVREDPHIILWELHIDGVLTKRHGKSNSTTIVTLVDLRFPPDIRYLKEFIIPVVITGKFYDVSPAMRLIPLISEMRDAAIGSWVFVDCNKNTIAITGAHLALIVVDSKAAPYINCQSVAPAIKGACSTCKIMGGRINNASGKGGRTWYPCISSGEEAKEWTGVDELREGLSIMMKHVM